MEMLLALMVFAILTLMATQTLAGLSQSTSSLWTHTARFREEVALERFLGVAAYGRSPQGRRLSTTDQPTLCLDQSPCLRLAANEDGQSLSWWQPDGTATRVSLESGPYEISRRPSALGGEVITMTRLDTDRAFEVSLRGWPTAPRDCRFNRTAGQCLPPEAIP